jgi:uncharacterized protein (DUF302 family)
MSWSPSHLLVWANELPLRVLIWQGPDGVMLGYKDPREWAARSSRKSAVGTKNMQPVTAVEKSRMRS